MNHILRHMCRCWQHFMSRCKRQIMLGWQIGKLWITDPIQTVDMAETFLPTFVSTSMLGYACKVLRTSDTSVNVRCSLDSKTARLPINDDRLLTFADGLSRLIGRTCKDLHCSTISHHSKQRCRCCPHVMSMGPCYFCLQADLDKQTT